MEISTAALMSIVALLIVVTISCVNENLNVGLLAVGFAIFVGGMWGGISGAKVMTAGWPISLFMILVGVTFLFGMAQANGTMEKLTTYALRLCKGNNVLIPFIAYFLMLVVSFIGPGNIAGPALMAPVLMPIAARVKMPAFLMTLLVAGGANGAAFSPFAPTGIISTGLIEKMAVPLGITDLAGLSWQIFFKALVAQSTVNLIGFALLGGWAWMKLQRGQTLDIDEFAPKPEPFDRNQKITLMAIAAQIFFVILPGLPGMKALLPKGLLLIFANAGTVAFMLCGILMLVGAGDSKKGIKNMPWGVICMVCGVTVLIDVMDKAGGLNAFVQLIGAISTPVTVNGTLALFCGIISAYSSSSGVVMPMFLPMVPGLIRELGGGDPIALISSINVGAHLVDTSPLSTLGALCIACAGDNEDKSRLFRNLLMWGLSMSIVGAFTCWLLFGVLGI